MIFRLIDQTQLCGLQGMAEWFRSSNKNDFIFKNSGGNSRLNEKRFFSEILYVLLLLLGTATLGLTKQCGESKDADKNLRFKHSVCN